MIETCLIIITILFIISLFGRNAKVRDDLERFMQTMGDYMKVIQMLDKDVQNIKEQLNGLHNQFTLKNIDINFPAMHTTSKKKPKLEVVTKKGEEDEDTEKD